MTVVHHWTNRRGSTLRLLDDGRDLVIDGHFEGVDEGLHYVVPIDLRPSVGLIFSMFVAQVMAAVPGEPAVTLH